MTARRVTVAASGAPSASGDGASVAIRPGRAAAEPATAATVETGDTRGGAGQRVAVQSLDGTFRPGRITVTTGTEVEWTNVGHQTHDILPVERSGWGVAEADFGPGATYAHTFDEPGTYDYYCTLHGTAHAGMIGTIIVTG